MSIILAPDAPWPRALSSGCKSLRVVSLPYARPGRFLWQRNTRDEWDAFIGTLRPDVYVSAAFVPTRLAVPQAVVVHDVLPVLHPQLVHPEKTAFFHEAIRDAVNHASLVVVTSDSTRADLMRLFSLPRARSLTLYPDIDGMMTRMAWRHARPPKRLAQMLMVGVKCARKNVTMVLDALVRLRSAGVQVPRTIFVGNLREDVVPVTTGIAERGLADYATITNYVSDAAMRRVMWSSAALLFPSMYEGFGMPLVEALASRTRVLCTRLPTTIAILDKLGTYLAADAGALALAMRDACQSPRGLPSRLCNERLAILGAQNELQFATLRKWIDEALGTP